MTTACLVGSTGLVVFQYLHVTYLTLLTSNPGIPSSQHLTRSTSNTFRLRIHSQTNPSHQQIENHPKPRLINMAFQLPLQQHNLLLHTRNLRTKSRRFRQPKKNRPRFEPRPSKSGKSKRCGDLCSHLDSGRQHIIYDPLFENER